MNALRVIVLLLVIVVVTCSKLSHEAVHKFYQQSRSNGETQTWNIWVFLLDKGPVQTPTILSDRAIARRRKMNMSTKDHDVPVYDEYINKIREIIPTNTIRATSNWLNAVSIVDVTRQQLEKITQLSFVTKIDIVAQYKRENPLSAQEPSKSKVRDVPRAYGSSYTQLQQMGAIEAHKQGYTGQNVLIAVLDSGFRTTHRTFARTNIVATYDFVRNDTIVDNQPEDSPSQFHHGTEVLSTIAGQDDGYFYGAAFNASFLLAKTESLDYESIAEEDLFVMGVEWAERLGADVISSSLGYREWWQPKDFDGNTSVTTRAINSAVEKGVACVVSAGNDGITGLSVPADAFNVITVGSVDSNNQVSYFSSRGPTYDGRIKPEVVAMGSQTSVVSPTSTTAYMTNSGTSFSCPLVAGAVALLLSAHPELTPLQVREALMVTAGNAASPNNNIGWGLVNVIGAINHVTNSKNTTSVPTTMVPTTVEPTTVKPTTTVVATTTEIPTTTPSVAPTKQVCGSSNCVNGFCRDNKCECYQSYGGENCDRVVIVSSATQVTLSIFLTTVFLLI